MYTGVLAGDTGRVHLGTGLVHRHLFDRSAANEDPVSHGHPVNGTPLKLALQKYTRPPAPLSLFVNNSHPLPHRSNTKTILEGGREANEVKKSGKS